MAKNPISWFEIYVNDMDRARAFYETVLDVKLDRLDVPAEQGFQMWSFPADMESYGASGALVRMPGFDAGNNSTLVYFACEDCALEESRVVAAGGQVQRPKMSIGQYGFITLAIDTEGNMLGLHSMN
ncbi:VOC family protein [Shewanella sedimentimangrovi]|uniref:VOC family protein n=1 Tax=Shewanella sedimentimangrovi TaxID=2814293 RepID=A0ABX7R6F8_9GAMM|nr:VOC family protein [Shewanella sedimentimangrovi]QSX38375.1 VOC family protein [Shewanella sedimentimangrovi]